MTIFTPIQTQVRPLIGAVTKSWKCSVPSGLGRLVIASGQEGVVHAGSESNPLEVGMIISGSNGDASGLITPDEYIIVVIHGPVYLGEIEMEPFSYLYLAADGLFTDRQIKQISTFAQAIRSTQIMING